MRVSVITGVVSKKIAWLGFPPVTHSVIVVAVVRVRVIAGVVSKNSLSGISNIGSLQA